MFTVLAIAFTIMMCISGCLTGGLLAAAEPDWRRIKFMSYAAVFFAVAAVTSAWFAR